MKKQAINRLIWKEFRENRKWLALLSLVFLVVIVGVIVESLSQYYYSRPLALRFNALVPLMLMSAPAAFFIGMIESFFEIRRDQWAYLTQRAVSRSQIFISKTAVGLGIYFLITGLPILVMYFWSWQPNSIRYDMADILILLSPVLASVGFYFTAVLIVFSSNRWRVIRYLGIVWLVVTGIVSLIWMAQISRQLTWPMFVWHLLTASVPALAAWGMFTKTEGHRCLRYVSRVSWASMLFVAFQLVLCVIITFAIRGHEEYQKRYGQNASPKTISWTNQHVDKQGHVIQVESQTGSDGQFVVTRAIDLDNPSSNEYQSLRAEALRNYHPYSNGSFLRLQTFVFDTPSMRDISRDLFVEGSTFVHNRLDVGEIGNYGAEQIMVKWIYSQSRGLFYYYLISQRSNAEPRPDQLFAIVGPEGYARPGEPLPKKRFGRLLTSNRMSNSGWPMLWLAPHEHLLKRELFLFDDGIYAIDLENFKTQQFYRPPSGKKICNVASGNVVSGTESRTVYILFEDEIQLYRPLASTPESGGTNDAKVDDIIPGIFFKSIPIPGSIAKFGMFSLGEVTATGEYIFVGQSGSISGNLLLSGLSRIVKMNSNGAITSQRDIATAPPPWNFHDQLDALAAAAITPLAVPLAVGGIDALYQATTGTGLVMSELNPNSKSWWLGLTSMLIAATLCALIAFRAARQRNLSQRDAICWTVIAFLFGPAGLLTLLCLREKPLKLACANCGSRTPVTRANCMECGQPAEAARTSTKDILDPELTTTAAV